MEEDDDQELGERAHVWPTFTSYGDMVSKHLRGSKMLVWNSLHFGTVSQFLQMGGPNLSIYELPVNTGLWSRISNLLCVGVFEFFI